MSWQPPQTAVKVFLPGPSGKSWAWADTMPSSAAEIAEIRDGRDMIPLRGGRPAATRSDVRSERGSTAGVRPHQLGKQGAATQAGEEAQPVHKFAVLKVSQVATVPSRRPFW